MLTEDETNPKAIGGLARLHVEAGDLDQAQAPCCRWRRRPRRARSRTPRSPPPGPPCIWPSRRPASAISRRCEKALAANPDDHQARFDLAVALNAKGERDSAADELLEIIKRDRAWNDDAARKQLLQFFEAWGLMDQSTVAARRKLSAIWF